MNLLKRLARYILRDELSNLEAAIRSAESDAEQQRWFKAYWKRRHQELAEDRGAPAPPFIINFGGTD